MFKKFMCLLMVIVCMSGLVACGGEEKEPEYVQTLNDLIDIIEAENPYYKVEKEYDKKGKVYILTVEQDKAGVINEVEKMLVEEGMDSSYRDTVVNMTMEQMDTNDEMINTMIDIYDDLLSGVDVGTSFKYEVRYKKLDGTLIKK